MEDSLPARTIPDSSVRVSKDLGRMLHVVARHRGLSVAEYMDQFVRPNVLREYVEALDTAKSQAQQELSQQATNLLGG